MNKKLMLKIIEKLKLQNKIDFLLTQFLDFSFFIDIEKYSECVYSLKNIIKTSHFPHCIHKCLFILLLFSFFSSTSLLVYLLNSVFILWNSWMKWNKSKGYHSSFSAMQV